MTNLSMFPFSFIAFLNALLRGSAYSQSSALRGFLKQSDKTSGASLFVAENDNGSQDYQGSIGDHGGLMSASAATSIHPYGAFGSAVSAMNSPRSNGIGAESVGDLIFQSHHQHNQHQTNNSATGSILSVGGDSLVAMEAKGLAINQQFKWRKLYTNLRVKLKPHEIGASLSHYFCYFYFT